LFRKEKETRFKRKKFTNGKGDPMLEKIKTTHHRNLRSGINSSRGRLIREGGEKKGVLSMNGTRSEE